MLAIVAVAIWLRGNPFPPGITTYWVQFGAPVVAIAALAALSRARAIAMLPGRCRALLLEPSPLAFGATVAVVATGLAVVTSKYAYSGAGTSSDEIAQLWHARMLLSGALSLPVDPNPEFFAVDNVVDIGRWFSQFPIGGPALLALGLAIGAPWLVNSALAGIAAVMMYFFGRGAFGEVEGRAIAALFATTAFVVLMAGSLMNHMPVLCLATVALAALPAWQRGVESADWSRDDKWRLTLHAIAIGCAIGASFTIRPLDAVVLAVAIGTFQVASVAKRPRAWPALGVQAMAAMLAVLPVLIANRLTTGSALRFGYTSLWGPAHNLGFHADPQGGVHTLTRGLEYATLYLTGLNYYVFLWPLPALVPVVIALVAAQRLSRWDALLIGLLGAQAAAYATYWYWGQFLGPRFLFTAVPTVVVLVARAPFLAAAVSSGPAMRAVFAGVLACIAIAWTPGISEFNAPGMARQLRTSRTTLKLDLAAAVRAAGIQSGVVFLREGLPTRIQRRMWGLGVSRSEAAQLLRTRDACSLLSAVREIESGAAGSPTDPASLLLAHSIPFTRSAENIRTPDPALHVASAESFSAECRAELAEDARLGGAPFGLGLPLLPISGGRMDGPVIYAADLGERNELLRARFGDRPWFRAVVVRTPAGTQELELEPWR